MTDADRIAELEEQIRQMKEAFAPTMTLPVTWRMPLRDRKILQALLTRDLLNANQYRCYCEPQTDDYVRSLTMRIGQVRRFLRKQIPTVKIKTRWGIGYYIERQDKQKILEAINAHNHHHNFRAVA